MVINVSDHRILLNSWHHICSRTRTSSSDAAAALLHPVNQIIHGIAEYWDLLCCFQLATVCLVNGIIRVIPVTISETFANVFCFIFHVTVQKFLKSV